MTSLERVWAPEFVRVCIACGSRFNILAGHTPHQCAKTIEVRLELAARLSSDKRAQVTEEAA